MQTARPDELKENALPVMTARLSEAELLEWFPVSFEEITDPWAAPEPSKGALIRLESGEYVVLDYGKESNQLIVRIPQNVDPSRLLASFFREVPMPRSRVLWHRAGAKLPRNLAARRVAIRGSRSRNHSSRPKRRS